MTKRYKKFINDFFKGISEISETIDEKSILKLVEEIKKLKDRKGRIFFLGVGGSAGNSSHAVNDFRKLCNIEAYTPLDNISELTARINDDGWDTSLSNWLKISKLSHKDAIFVLSVGGGNLKKKISVNLIKAAIYAKKKKSKIFGIVGKKDGFIGKNSDSVVIIPEVNKSLVTPYSEAYQAVVWHALVSHPILKSNKTKW
jgi:D-sedoheptulose 7-phosphate isomerase